MRAQVARGHSRALLTSPRSRPQLSMDSRRALKRSVSLAQGQDPRLHVDVKRRIDDDGCAACISRPDWSRADPRRSQGTNGSQLWDAAFIAQALYESGLATEEQNYDSTRKLLLWIDRCQIRENPRWFAEMSRHASKGAWPFSTREQGYTISE